VEEQRARIDRLKALRRDTGEAERTLDTFNNVLGSFEDILTSVQAIRRTSA
jgi:hypothetical protein